MTAWCNLVKDGHLQCFEELRVKFDLDKHDFFMYLQLRDYYNKEIEGKAKKELNGVVQLIMRKYSGEGIRFISGMY